MRIGWIIAIVTWGVGIHSQAPIEAFSVHRAEDQYYSRFSTAQLHRMFKSAHRVKPVFKQRERCNLNKVVFGFHPYWEEGAEVNYDWDLLSDFCYFNYTVDPTTGGPTTVHEWMSAGSVDAALAHGVRLHLAMTLFGNHATFLNNKAAQRNFSSTIIQMLKARHAIGVNLDIEAIPKTLKKKLTSFVLFFGKELHREIPGSILSIDIPAVDWSGTFEISKMKKEVDLFFIMGYGYYYGGSSESGPTAPLYSLVDYYDYNLSRTISYYQSVGMPMDKMILGLPYYGKAWKVSKQGAPAKTLSKGTNVFYRDTRKNENGYYSRSNARWASTSYSNYFLYKKSGAWYHAFVLSAKEQRSKMEIIRQRGLAGTGMWALGYDDGYSELWDVIRETMTDCYAQPCSGTLYDSGGPYGDYFDSEDYGLLIKPSDKGTVKLKFSYCSIDKNGDYLAIYDGEDATGTLLGNYTGTVSIPSIHSKSHALYLKFHSNATGRKKGFKALWTCDTMNVATATPRVITRFRYEMVPNPTSGKSRLNLLGIPVGNYILRVFDSNGTEMFYHSFTTFSETYSSTIDLRDEHSGLCFWTITNPSGKLICADKLILE